MKATDRRDPRELDRGRKNELITIKVQPGLLRDLKALGERRGISYSKIVRSAAHAEVEAARVAGEIPRVES